MCWKSNFKLFDCALEARKRQPGLQPTRASQFPRTRKNPFALVSGTLTLWPFVVTTPLQELAGKKSVRSTTNGGAPPVQVRFTFAPMRAIITVIAGVTVTTTAS
jgi:hypothetical protein